MPDAAPVPAALAATPIIDVCVVMCTVDRFDMADRTIDSIMRQTNRTGLRYEMIVVDNSEQGLSRGRIAAAAATAQVPLRYVHEPRRNISHARNSGIAASSAEFVAFIDDDEIAPENWLDTMLAAARDNAADVVVGAVYPAYEGGSPPPWDPQGRYPIRDQRLPTGAPIEQGISGNILLRAATCLTDSEPFDPKYGRTGGSDTDFTRRLRRQGRLLVWCADSIVTEFQPRRRTTLAYYSQRVFISTKNDVRSKLRDSNHKIADGTHIITTAAIQIVVFLVPYLLSYRWPTQGLVKMRFRFLRGLAKITASHSNNLY